MTPQPSPTNLSDELKTILDDFARWTIQNVEHGIYIPLPSPETEAAITAAYAEAGYRTGEEWYEQFRHEYDDMNIVHDLMAVEAAARASGLLPNNASDEGSATE